MAKLNAKKIDETAAAWVARRDRGLTPAEERELAAWLTADDRHLGAFGRMQALFLNTERALAPDGVKASRQVAGTGLGRRVLIGSGVAALGGAIAAGFAVFVVGGEQRFSTRKGEVRVVPLGDGSVITLNTASTVAVRYTREQRSIDLVAGEALFDVAKDPARPFIVAAGAVKVRAVGTSFTVRRLPSSPVVVLVQEGVVEVRDAAAPVVRLSANMRIAEAVAAGRDAVTVPAAQVQRELIWREGRIAFEGETLRDACAEFARYSETKIVIDDPELGQEEISGTFQANDPVGFGKAVAEALGVRVKVNEGEVRLLR